MRQLLIVVFTIAVLSLSTFLTDRIQAIRAFVVFYACKKLTMIGARGRFLARQGGQILVSHSIQP